MISSFICSILLWKKVSSAMVSEVVATTAAPDGTGKGFESQA
jgi:hypothetical protein